MSRSDYIDSADLECPSPLSSLATAIEARLALASKCVIIITQIIKELKHANSASLCSVEPDIAHLLSSLADSLAHANAAIEEIAALRARMQTQTQKIVASPSADDKEKERRQATLSRLMKDESSLVDKFSIVHKLAIKQIKRSQQAKNTNNANSTQTHEEGTELKFLKESDRQRVLQLKDGQGPGYVTIDSALVDLAADLDDRHKLVQKIEKDLGQVNEMYKDLNHLVSYQASSVDELDRLILDSNVKNRSALEELYIAEDTQQRKRTRWCYMMFVLLAATIFFMLFLWVIL